ncbi:class I SAM-dependent methyltransferase [Pseudovibrio sp. SPO723]|uniref:class I SAM-dependent methyltransferase n=1 Tax=Nesiotobacter zosterae TaxID=392721 RepID=UPI0029C1A6E1|nr:class I SAM-dependent methyltransferase [Pseudovibrio sp. SPO723]MDX5595209.1 class I SAM-dependent methyltransferase [Pseudovibrio sp. SPO723]
MLDPALETLLLPFENDSLDVPEGGKVLFLRARFSPKLKEVFGSALVCQQSFAPDADILSRAGLELVEAPVEAAEITLVLPPRQKQEARALLAHAVNTTRDGGFVVACVSNTEGAKSCEADLNKLAGLDGKLSKHKCRVFWAAVSRDTLDGGLLNEWLQLDMPREIEDGRFTSRPGIFSWDHIDPASKLLVSKLPEGLKGRVADLGAGYGYLSTEILQRCSSLAALDLYEAEKRALDLAAGNIGRLEPKIPVEFHWADVTRGLKHSYDFVVMNPPFHTGKADRTDLGQAFIVAASKGLKPGGSLYMVANRHLPYESTLDRYFESFEIIADEQGYKVIQAKKARR